jgi:hypothetical protein
MIMAPYPLAMIWIAAFAVAFASLFALLVIVLILIGIAPRSVRRLLTTAGFPPLDSRS